METTAREPQPPGEGLDELLTIGQVCHLLARPNGRPLHQSTVYRWATAGLNGCRLRVVTIGRQMRTTQAWLREFGAAVAAARGLATKNVRSA